MARSSPNSGRRVLLGLAATLALGVASCRQLGIVADVVFPSTVPGLPADQSWESLPLRRWLTETGIEPVAISACFSCPEPVVAGYFRARGADGVALRRALANPAALLSGRTVGKVRRSPRVRPGLARVAAQPAQEGGLAGALMVATGSRGRRAAVYGMVVERAGVTSAVVIVAVSEEAARRIARGVAPNL